MLSGCGECAAETVGLISWQQNGNILPLNGVFRGVTPVAFSLVIMMLCLVKKVGVRFRLPPGALHLSPTSSKRWGVICLLKYLW